MFFFKKNCFENKSFRKNLPSGKGVEGLSEKIAKRKGERKNRRN